MIKYIIILLLLMSPAWANLNLDKVSPINEKDLARFQLIFNQDFVYSTQKNFQKIEMDTNDLYNGLADLDISSLTLDPGNTQLLTASDAISVSGSALLVGGSGTAVVLASTPTIASGTNGKIILVIGTDDTNTVTLQHGSSYNLKMDSGQNFTLGKGDLIAYKYNSTIGSWIEMFRCNNG